MSTATITLTPKAIDRILFLQEGEENAATYLRVYIIGGGCSGFQYGFAFESTPQEDDQIILQNIPESDKTIGVIIDPLSFPFLRGATVDYQSGLYGARFTVQNPNAKSTCGCGSSFSV